MDVKVRVVHRAFPLALRRAWFQFNSSSSLTLELAPLVKRPDKRDRYHFYRPKAPPALRGMGDVAPDQSRREDASAGPLDVDVGVGDSKPHFLRQQFLEPHHSSTNQHESYYTFHSASDGVSYQIRHPSRPHQPGTIDWNDLPEDFRQKFKTPEQIAYLEIHKSNSTAEPTLTLDELSPDLRAVFKSGSPGSNAEKADPPACDSPHDSTAHTASPSKRSLRKQERIAEKKELRKSSRERAKLQDNPHRSVMSSNTNSTESSSQKSPPAQHKPLVVGRTKPKSTSISSMEASSIDKVTPAETKAELNHEIEKNLSSNTDAAAPTGEAANPTKKKEKTPKQSKPPKAAPAAAPLSPAIIDLRVGHILRAINHPNADSLYVSTIAMGDPEGTDHTQVDEETGKIVRTVCSGLNGLVPLAEMQDRKVVVVANLKPVNMRSIKSAAMVLAASPPAEEGADPHAADRVVELVNPPEGSEAGDKVFFEGWSYGEGKGPEKQLNPKKKQWEAIQPGFFTSDDLLVGFDAGKSEVEGSENGMLVVEGKGKCTVKTLKGAVVR